MTDSAPMDRRDFVRAGATAGAGLLVALTLPSKLHSLLSANRAPVSGTALPNGWIMIAPDGLITIRIEKSEMGQGVMTSMPMIIAEELDADWSRVRVEQAPIEPSYSSPTSRNRGTGGSTSIRTTYSVLRTGGATARAMLVSAAAARWGVDPSALTTRDSVVRHEASGRSATYGDLAAAAGALTPPTQVPVKDPRHFRLIGTSPKRVDSGPKVRGTAVYGIDIVVPGMLFATVQRCAACGGKMKSVDDTAALRVDGVRKVVAVEGGVAIVATSTWAALQGRKVLQIAWDESGHETVNSASIAQALARGTAEPGAVGFSRGTLPSAGRVVEAAYDMPFLAHASMEPMNCTAYVKPDGTVDVWVPTQAQTGAANAAAKLAGVAVEKVRVYTTMLGGGFGRRSENDFVKDAVQISMAVGAPVKVLWTREDDMQFDWYRPAARHHFRATLGPDGAPTGLLHRVSSASILKRFMPALPKGVDEEALSGSAGDLLYDVPNLLVEYRDANVSVPVGWWRSVGHSHSAFAIESFVDELASAAGIDPVEYRRRVLRGNEPRARGVLDLAAKASGWGTPLAAGHARGIALVEGFGSYVAQVAEVSVSKAGEVTVHRVSCAVDCGVVINPDGIESQIHSGIVYGLTAALKGEITLERGRVQQSNFNNYRVMRMNEMPAIDVHLVPSAEAPGGIGEPGTPPIAPAVANAIFAATGKRVRRLPLRSQDVRG